MARQSTIRPLPQAAEPGRFEHLRRLTGRFGLFEHAHLDAPRIHHGYCTDDNARALVVLCRADPFPQGMLGSFRRYLDFVISARTPEGWHNRRSPDGRWTDRVGSDDSQGRALWGLGVAARSAPTRELREAAAEAFALARPLDTPYPRSNAFVVLGSVEALKADDVPANASSLLETAAARLPRPLPGTWRWPEERLTYANARIPEALIAAGEALGDKSMVDDGLDLLDWLAEIESAGDAFSFTPVGGRGRVHPKPAFDQQPIEAWAMADACRRAALVSRDRIWDRRRRMACAWFLGTNDKGVKLHDPGDGGCFDGLTAHGVNRNRGAESTLSGLGAMLSLDSDR